jgi:IS30 family transposase
MTKSYKRITLDERVRIEKLLSHNKTYTEIGFILNRHKSSICREVNRMGISNYKSLEADMNSYKNSSERKYGKTKMNQHPFLKKYVLAKLDKFWSPDQISESLSSNYIHNKEMQISRETIYMHIYLHSNLELKKVLIQQLRQKRKFRGNVRRGADKRTTIKDPIRIDERPLEVKGREIPGHWEGDLIMGKEGGSAIGTLVERTTRAVILVHLKARDAQSVRKAFENAFKLLPVHMKKSLTYDNGTEMAQHKLFTARTKIAVYFAHPYSPWERPTNENTNGLLRDYFPKGMDLSTVTKKRLKEVQNELNERPRRVLNYQTPKDVFESYILAKL